MDLLSVATFVTSTLRYYGTFFTTQGRHYSGPSLPQSVSLKARLSARDAQDESG